MIERCEKEWSELENKAFELLRSFRLLSKKEVSKLYNPMLRLWIYPSFQPYQVWYFCEPHFKAAHLKNFKIIGAIWDRNEDYRRLSDPLKGLKEGFEAEPRIEVSSIEIEREFFEKIFDELKQIQFPAFANYRKSIGIDGVRSGIETFDTTHKTSISWWSVYPDEWQNIIDWFEKTVDLIEEKFNDR